MRCSDCSAFESAAIGESRSCKIARAIARTNFWLSILFIGLINEMNKMVGGKTGRFDSRHFVRSIGMDRLLHRNG